MSALDFMSPELLADGDRGAAVERIAADLREHLTRRTLRNGAADAAVVADGALIGALRHIAASRGDDAVVGVLQALLDEARARIAAGTAPAGAVLQ